MYRECRHILPTGNKCKCPALNGQLRCHFHSRMRHHSDDGLSDRKEPLILPSLEDVRGIQIALMQVTNALGSGRITSKQAGLYLYALQIASTLAARAEKQATVDPVRSVTCDNWGNIIAEEVTVCEPPHDCLHCDKRSTCDKFEDYQDEVEELEEQLEEQQEEEDLEDEEDESEEADGDEEDEDDDEEARESILENLHAQAAEEPETKTQPTRAPQNRRPGGPPNSLSSTPRVPQVSILRPGNDKPTLITNCRGPGIHPLLHPITPGLPSSDRIYAH